MGGFSTARLHGGTGYATEATAGALKYGRDVVGLPDVVAHALATNDASIAVMRRLKFVYERNLNLPAGPHVLYRRALTGSWRGRNLELRLRRRRRPR